MFVYVYEYIVVRVLYVSGVEIDIKWYIQLFLLSIPFPLLNRYTYNTSQTNCYVMNERRLYAVYSPRGDEDDVKYDTNISKSSSVEISTKQM